jgi:hypothetical protein
LGPRVGWEQRLEEKSSASVGEMRYPAHDTLLLSVLTLSLLFYYLQCQISCETDYNAKHAFICIKEQASILPYHVRVMSLSKAFVS